MLVLVEGFCWDASQCGTTDARKFFFGAGISLTVNQRKFLFISFK